MKKIIIAVIMIAVIAIIAYSMGLFSPSHSATEEAEEAEMAAAEKLNPMGPAFNADSAYAFVAAQCAFGPRAMNTKSHDECGEWIAKKFESFGCKVKNQRAELRGYDGTMLRCRNIMASYNPESTTRILLCAHWDTRPWADNDPDSANWRKPIDGANDGASGVAVMLEIARLLNQNKNLNIGVDFVCFDAEDWGTPKWSGQEDSEDTWALGAQHFATNLPAGYEARYGILLDLVGGIGAKFYREGMSKSFAPDIVKKVWRAARAAGYGSFFPKSDGGMITDDHVPLNEKAKIPTIDIIAFYPDCVQSSFGPTWHTLNDNLQNIDRNTLKAVGQTVIQTLYSEK